MFCWHNKTSNVSGEEVFSVFPPHWKHIRLVMLTWQISYISGREVLRGFPLAKTYQACSSKITKTSNVSEGGVFSVFPSYKHIRLVLLRRKGTQIVPTIENISDMSADIAKHLMFFRRGAQSIPTLTNISDLLCWHKKASNVSRGEVSHHKQKHIRLVLLIWLNI